MFSSRLRLATGAAAVAVAVALTGCAAGDPADNTTGDSAVSGDKESASAPKISPPESAGERKTGVATPPEHLLERETAVVPGLESEESPEGSGDADDSPESGGSSTPAQGGQPSQTQPKPKPAVTPTPTASTPPAATAPALAPDNNTSGWSEYKTLNGTASLRAPSNWGKPAISGEWVTGYSQEKLWANVIQWSPVAGKSWNFSYADNPYTDTGVCLPKSDYQVVESVDANYMLQDGASTKLGGLSAARWAEKDTGSGKWVANVAIVTAGGSDCQPSPGTIVNGKAVYVNAFGDALTFDSQQAAVNWLAGPEGTLAMNAVETLKIYNVPATTEPTQAP